MSQLESAYREIYELTHAACGTCQDRARRLPYRCCDPVACANTKRWAAIKGVELAETGHPELPYMGPNGCTVALELRPLCTMHSCTNCDGDPKYFELKRRIEQYEAEDWKKFLELEELGKP